MNQRKRNRKVFTPRDAFIELIEKYSIVSIEDINKEVTWIEETAKTDGHVSNAVEILGIIPLAAMKLTGFGSTDHCSLCKIVENCSDCWWVRGGSQRCNEHRTFGDIKCAKNAEELLEAYKNRATYMKILVR